MKLNIEWSEETFENDSVRTINGGYLAHKVIKVLGKDHHNVLDMGSRNEVL